MASRPALHHAAAFLASFLLFELELLAAKLLLPFFGGSAQVWTTSMMLFQAMLLAGYLYGHLAAARLNPRAHARAHLGVLGLSLLALPLSVVPSHSSWPVLAVALALLRSIGFPFVVLSATVPTLHRLSAAKRSGTADDGFVLYAYSNAGALAGLLAYPFVIEPLLSLKAQIALWEACYVAFILLHVPSLLAEKREEKPASQRSDTGWLQFATWVCLAAGPCAAMLAASNFLACSMAALPLLWVIPLGTYLLTFILNFKRTPWRPSSYERTLMLVAVPPAAILAIGCLGKDARINGVAIFRNLVDLGGLALNVAGLFVLAMICHRSLAVSKPREERRASAFYLAISIGGLLGGVLLALLVPWLGRDSGWPGLDWATAGLLCLAALFLRDWDAWERRRAFRPAAGVVCAAVVTAAFLPSRPGPRTSLRNFYGLYAVEERPPLRVLLHGNTMHGMQYLDPAKAGEPVSYYHKLSPIADAFRLFGKESRQVSILGLGAGALAAYGRPGMTMTFYELDPDVLALARAHFSFLERSPARIEVVTGDGRLALEQRRGPPSDLLVLDAFNGGAIPAHLLTREAFELYFRRLSPGGVLLCNISNRHLDLRPVLAAAARSLGVSSAYRLADPPPGWGAEFSVTQWAALSADAGKIASLESAAGWKDLSSQRLQRIRPWADGYVSVLPLIRF